MVKSKKFLWIAFGIYVAVLLYFMFFGFGRLQITTEYGYRYSFLLNSIPLWLPKSLGRVWVFSLGNLLAFVPIGLLTPLLFQRLRRYLVFIGAFVAAVFCLELLQMVTYLGSFDIADILINTMGATIGYGTYRAAAVAGGTRKKFAVGGLTCVALTVAAFVFAEIFNNTVTPLLS